MPTPDPALATHVAGDLNAAKAGYALHCTNHPDDTNAWHLYAIACGQSGDIHEGLRAMRHALSQAPNDPSLHATMGQLARHLNDVSLSSHHLHRACELAPDWPHPHNQCGLLLFHTQQVEAAKACFEQALQHNPNFHEARYNLARCFHHLQQPDAAETTLNTLIAHEPHHTLAHRLLGQLHQQANRHAQALTHYTAAMAHDPTANDDPQLHHWLGCAYLGMDDMAQAEHHFHLALEHDPNHVETHHNLASLYLLQKNTQQALHHWHQCLALAPEEPDTLYNLGVTYRYAGRLNDATDYLERCLTQGNHTLEAHINLAAICLKRGTTLQAYHHYQDAARLDPSHDHTQYMLAALRSHPDVVATVGDPPSVPERAPTSYVTALFDDYAPIFDRHLSEHLAYSFPSQLASILTSTFGGMEPAHRWHKAVDLGAGTGLCAPALRAWSDIVWGVDCSEAMLAQAERKACYDRLVVQELMTFLHHEDAAADVFLAADVLPYFGDLSTVFHAMDQALRPGGHVILTTEVGHHPTPYTLQPTARYTHRSDAVKAWLLAAGWNLLTDRLLVTRQQGTQAVQCQLYIAHKPRTTA